MCSHSLHLIEDDAKHRNVSINEEYQSATRQSAVGGRQLKAYTLAQTDIHWINCFGNGFFIAGSGPINWFVSRFAHQNPFGMVSFLLGNQPQCPMLVAHCTHRNHKLLLFIMRSPRVRLWLPSRPSLLYIHTYFDGKTSHWLHCAHFVPAHSPLDDCIIQFKM